MGKSKLIGQIRGFRLIDYSSDFLRFFEMTIRTEGYWVADTPDFPDTDINIPTVTVPGAEVVAPIMYGFINIGILGCIEK